MWVGAFSASSAAQAPTRNAMRSCPVSDAPLISHPLPSLARALVDAMSKAIVDRGSEPLSRILLFDVFTSENV